MAKFLIVLSMENIELSKYETIIFLGLKTYSMYGNLLIAEVPSSSIRKICRLSYAKKVFELLFECETVELKKKMSAYGWKSEYKKNFCLRIHHDEQSKKTSSEIDEKKYASYIWNSLEKSRIKPEVKLDNPVSAFEIFIDKKTCFACRLACENAEDFESRKTEFWPEHHPTTMNPRMARALVNLADCDEIVDPFCGAGGILIEACLMDIKCKGYDIDKAMLERAEINLHHYGIKKHECKLKRLDSTKLKNLKNIVTDLPYGKSSKKSVEITKLYSKFISRIAGRSVIVMPDFVNYKTILKKNLSKKLRIVKMIRHYVHKSLTRIIIIIDKKK